MVLFGLAGVGVEVVWRPAVAADGATVGKPCRRTGKTATRTAYGRKKSAAARTGFVIPSNLCAAVFAEKSRSLLAFQDQSLEEFLAAVPDAPELAVPDGALAGAFFGSIVPEDAPVELPPEDGESGPEPAVFAAAGGAAEFLPRESLT